ncbi:helix-turn-helix transcriptional regulator [Cognatishimia activa]|uniref:Response regulator transcription factor n=1 Tax=Cognatishimia activa TaxID=1715691 RepID=A0A975I6K5_9RHOB|nr:LuxR C-terminal-related transcriptional regulator [Cognatishimia activa]QTN35020.1 response regulator transcription factor [Cognatishimia activa]
MDKNRAFLIAVTAVQGACAVFFVSDILLTIIGVRTNPIRWQTRELLEIGAAIGLTLGVVFGYLTLRRSLKRTAAAEASLRSVQMTFQEHIQDRFNAWELTAAERDVALFTIKGLSVSDIAELRATSEGTVKAQSAGIYRKAGVNNRTQLVSLFIDDLLEQDG